MRPLQVSVEVASYQKNSPDSRLFVYSVLIWGWKIPIPVVFVIPVRGNRVIAASKGWTLVGGDMSSGRSS